MADRPFAHIARRQLCCQQDRMPNALQIVATGVLYYHDADERAFFEWLDRMVFVREYHGVARDLFIEFSRFPTDDDLWEMIGFCRRYGIDMAQLAKFETVENSTWMRDPKMVWHTEIFANSGCANGS
jgi:hypothetical protein